MCKGPPKKNGFQANGLRPIVEDTTVYCSYHLTRLRHTARADNVAIKLAIDCYIARCD